MFLTAKHVLAAAVVLAAAAAPSSAFADTHAHAVKLSPPVIHESFTPLPCAGAPGHRSTLEDEGCAEQQILRSDEKIDVLNESIFAKLPGDPARRQFIAGHRAWIAYRHAYCLSVSDVFAGGTEAGVLDADCVAGVTNQHVKDLRGFLADLGSD